MKTMLDDPCTRRDALRALALTTTVGMLAPLPPHAAPAPATAHTHGQEQLRMGSEQIVILVYPEFTALDALGPHYALAGMMGASVRFVAKSLDPVPSEGASQGGFCVRPHLTFANCPKTLDLLLVPGGVAGTLAAIEDRATRTFLAERSATAKTIGSVCTGSLLLGAAGLLQGHRATCHWQMLDVLQHVGATPVAERIVFSGTDRVTAAGVSAGLDLGFELVRRYRGDFYAKGMQLLAEYDPQPPFTGGGNPRTADRLAVDMLNAMHAPLAEKFKASLALANPPRAR